MTCLAAEERDAGLARAGPLSIWRYADVLPVEPPARRSARSGVYAAVEAPRLASALGLAELYLKLDTANPTHSFKDRVVAVACAKAQELGLDTLACSSTGNLANAVAARASAEGMEAAVFCPADLEPEKLVATAVYGATIYAVRGTYDDCSRLTRRALLRGALGICQRRPAGLLRGGLEDARLRDRRAARLAAPDAVVAPIASGAMYSKVSRGFSTSCSSLGSSMGGRPRMYRRAGRGLRPGRDRLRREPAGHAGRPNSIARSLAIGNPGRRRARRRARRGARTATSTSRRRTRSGQHGAARGDDGVFGETAAGVTLGALRKASQRPDRRGRPCRPARHGRRVEDA